MKNLGVVQPIKKVNISEEIINRFVQFIKEGQMEPGEKVMSERELCELFGASRTSVREALQGLTSMGVLVKRRDGNYVCDDLADIIARPISILMNSNDLNMEEVFEARIAIETQIARIAAESATDEEIAKIESCLLATQNSTGEKAMRHSMEFHLCIAQSTHNRILQEMYTIVYRIMSEMRNNEGRLRQVHKSQNLHHDILDAIREHDPARAEQVTRHHLLVLKSATLGEK